MTRCEQKVLPELIQCTGVLDHVNGGCPNSDNHLVKNLKFKPGDRVELVIDNDLLPSIRRMIEGRVGLVTAAKDLCRDYVVQFEGTQRPGGYFALDEENLKGI